MFFKYRNQLQPNASDVGAQPAAAVGKNFQFPIVSDFVMKWPSLNQILLPHKAHQEVFGCHFDCHPRLMVVYSVI